MSLRRPNAGDNGDFDVIGDNAPTQQSSTAVRLRPAVRQAPLARIESLYDDTPNERPFQNAEDRKRYIHDEAQKCLLKEKQSLLRQMELQNITSGPPAQNGRQCDTTDAVNRKLSSDESPSKSEDQPLLGSTRKYESPPETTGKSLADKRRHASDKEVSSKGQESSDRLSRELVDAVHGDNATRVKSIIKHDSLTAGDKLRALHAAAARGSNKVVKALLDGEPALVNQADPDDGSTALLVAVEARYVTTVSLLVDRGAKLDAKNAMGDGVWDLTERLSNDAALAPTLVGLFKKHRKDYATTPVHESAANGNVERIEYLAGIGLDLWSDDRAGYNFIHIAAFNDRSNVIAHFLDAGRTSKPGADSAGREKSAAAVDRRNSVNGKTALHVAANRGHLDAVETLLKCGAKPAMIDSAGWTALHEAAVCRSDSEATAVIRTLTLWQPDVLATRTEDGETPLHVAARHGRLGAVRMLLELQRDGGSLTVQDNDGWTPLHSAVDSKQAGVVEAIVDATNAAFDVHSLLEQQDKSGRSALQLAKTRTDCDDVVRVLESHKPGGSVRC